MSLVAGTRLGPYEILSPLGAGGMGEVYQARDSRLDRDVAIKVLPESLLSDVEALARFERALGNMGSTVWEIWGQPCTSCIIFSGRKHGDLPAHDHSDERPGEHEGLPPPSRGSGWEYQD